jgi:hypothetical protein
MKINPWLLIFCLVVATVAAIFHIYQHKYALALLTIIPVIPAIMIKKFRDHMFSR